MTSAHVASLESWDGGSHRWPEPRACLGHLGSWGLSKLGKVQGWGGGEPFDSSLTPKKGTGKVNLGARRDPDK